LFFFEKSVFAYLKRPLKSVDINFLFVVYVFFGNKLFIFSFWNVCLSLCLSVSLSLCLSVSLSLCLSVSLSLCLSVSLSLCLSLYLSFSLCLSLSLNISLSLSLVYIYLIFCFVLHFFSFWNVYLRRVCALSDAHCPVNIVCSKQKVLFLFLDNFSLTVKILIMDFIAIILQWKLLNVITFRQSASGTN
jgi:hypothetical protein